MTDPVEIKIPTGILKSRSRAASGARYTDAQWMRFRDGEPEKIGGWTRNFVGALQGLVRGMFAWTTLAGADLTAAGTSTKLYSTSDAVADITPLDAEGTLTNPFSTTSGSAIVNVASAGHGRVAGALVRFSGASAVGGITIDGEYAVTTTPDTDNFTITHSAPAGSTAGPGGGSVDYEYELNPGLESTAFGLGWGAGGWGEGTWGTPRDIANAIELEARHWFFGRYGSHLLALPSGGTLYEWDQPNNDERAIAVTNAPASARAMFVTSERFPVMLGTTTPMTIQWPDQDDITDWTPAEANTANSRALQNGNKIIAGSPLTEQVNLIWTDTSLYLMQYTGSQFVYDTRLVSDACGLLGPAGFCTALGTGYWISKAGFLMYQGGIIVMPRSDEIRDFVLKGLAEQYAFRIWCGYNPKFHEVWWGYPDAGNTEPNRYVMVNLSSFDWSTGTLARTAMSSHASAVGGPVMAGTDSFIYRHESGLNDADGGAIVSYIETGIVAVSGPGRDTEFFSFIPDFTRQAGDVSVELNMYELPRSPDPVDSATLTVGEADLEVETRLNGRYATMKVTSNAVDGDIRIGIPQLDPEPGGER